MEQTLGKRIAMHRKRLGLTQDALAEQLGITAQAVSKWENDLSCPDITMLPKLAEIFGITTDTLLGYETPKTFDAEVVNPHADNKDEDDDNDHWEFHWDAGRRHGLTFALFVLLVGGLLLAARILGWDVSLWSIAWPSALLVYGLSSIFQGFSVWSLGVALIGGCYLVENLGIWEWNISGKLIFPICLVVFGLGLVLDALRKPKKPRMRIKKGNHKKDTKVECTNEGDSFHCELQFGDHRHTVDVATLHSGNAELSFGELVVDLSMVDSVTQDCAIQAECAFGQLAFLVPSRFRVEIAEQAAAFGSVQISGKPDEMTVGTIRFHAQASFGEVLITYI